ncbi:MAG: hypothetical protein O3A01_04185 [bacterium]|nr:hypothetical protein [bacterium]
MRYPIVFYVFIIIVLTGMSLPGCTNNAGSSTGSADVSVEMEKVD